MKSKIIRCVECGGEMRCSDVYHCHDKFIGDFDVPARPEEYYHCAECACEIVEYSLMKRLEQAEQERIEQLLLDSVDGNMKRYKENLIRNHELVAVLGKSRQAIQQDGRIKTLIFHHVSKNGEILYWKKSVDLYKSKGDGRFSLLPEENVSAPKMKIPEFKVVSYPSPDSMFSSSAGHLSAYSESTDSQWMPERYRMIPKCKYESCLEQ